MKKKFFAMFLAVILATSCTVVPASAYITSATATITQSSPKIIFKGTTSTNAPSSMVSHIETQMYVYNYMSGKTYFNVDGTDDTVTYLTLSRITDLQNVWYVNEVTGIVQYAGTSSYDIKNAYKQLNLTGRSESLYSIASTDSIAGFHKSVRAGIMTSFDYDPQMYSYYLNSELSSAVGVEQYLSIRNQLELDSGDTIPGYYVDTNSNTIIAVNQNENDENQLFVFTLDNDNWVLAT